MRTIQPWASGETGTKTNPSEIGVTAIGMGAAGQTDAMTARDTLIGIRVTVVVGGTTGATEVGIDETVGQDPGLRGGHDPEIWITEDGEGLGRG